MTFKILVSNGEILDKLSILKLKEKVCQSTDTLNNITTEIDQLIAPAKTLLADENIQELYNRLSKVNEQLWHIEDSLRQKEKEQKFDNDFIELARQVYINNDRRAKIKKEINTKSKSVIVEEKIYE